MQNQGTNILTLFRSVVRHWELILQLTKRNVIGKYRGSILGLFWSFFNPLIMLGVYTFAFGVVFQAKWGIENETKLDFALVLFASLIVFNLFGEIVKESPSLIVSNASYVKKVIFPLEILPIVSLLSSIFHAFISFGVLFIFYGLYHFYIHWTFVFLPIVLFPLILMSLAVSYFLASIGVFIRDLGYIIGHIITVILFVSPVFYSIERIPPLFQKFMIFNPLAYLLEDARSVFLFGQFPNWQNTIIASIFGFVLLCTGFWFFQKTRKTFADFV
ncbi:ABC transporter permease [Leptospira sp. FAT2]|uniref:ABC transporter permease n=1 Tax=Leptospira sanjuanensis TaxID=2879643 RepID=UPI001EE90AE2|nr:ABC transporter permease [Leptospira sanjuanensis]MCG6167583.1 ABC transporter permease [Leptospira sanjuanensis]MCG6193002.1 ABC transporter permease [Leptospira sanjuanensis]